MPRPRGNFSDVVEEVAGPLAFNGFRTARQEPRVPIASAGGKRGRAKTGFERQCRFKVILGLLDAPHARC